MDGVDFIDKLEKNRLFHQMETVRETASKNVK